MVHCRVLKRPPLAPILSQINPVHTAPSCFCKIRLILSFYLCLRLPSSSFLGDFPQNLICIPLLSLRATYITSLILLEFISLTKIMQIFIMRFPSTFRYFIPPRCKYSPQHPVLELSKATICQVSHPFKTTYLSHLFSELLEACMCLCV
jgi:hypothetical protein